MNSQPQRGGSPVLYVVAGLMLLFAFCSVMFGLFGAAYSEKTAADWVMVLFFVGLGLGIGAAAALIIRNERRKGSAPSSVAGQAGAPPRILPPAGWYAAPDGNGQQYWDGRTWTDHRTPHPTTFSHHESSPGNTD